jgi:hypothetical protein
MSTEIQYVVYELSHKEKLVGAGYYTETELWAKLLKIETFSSQEEAVAFIEKKLTAKDWVMDAYTILPVYRQVR